jgi:hypothetical protein
MLLIPSTVNCTKFNRYCSVLQSTVPSSTGIVPFYSQLYQVQQLLFRSTVTWTKVNSYCSGQQSTVPSSTAIVLRSTVNCTKFNRCSGQQSNVTNSTAIVPVNSQLNQVQQLLFRSTVLSSTTTVLFRSNSHLYQIQQQLFRSTVNCTKFNSYCSGQQSTVPSSKAITSKIICVLTYFCSSNNDKKYT